MIDLGEWTPVRSPQGRLICYINRKRGLLKWQHGGDVALIDLAEFLDVIRPARDEARTQQAVE